MKSLGEMIFTLCAVAISLSSQLEFELVFCKRRHIKNDSLKIYLERPFVCPKDMIRAATDAAILIDDLQDIFQ